MFSEYCEEPFTVEPVNVTYETEEPAYTTPNMSSRTAAASLKEIKNVLGVELVRASHRFTVAPPLSIAPSTRPLAKCASFATACS